MTWVPNESIANQLSRATPGMASFMGRLHIVHHGDTSNDLWHSSYNGEHWIPNVRIPNQQSKTTPALAAFGNRLHMVHLGNTSNDLWHSIYDGKDWLPNTKIASQKSKLAPALAVFRGQLHMVHSGDTSNDLWHSVFDGQRWTTNVRIPNQLSKGTPALAAFGGRLHMVHLGDTSNNLWHSTFDGYTWSDNVLIQNQLSSTAPSLTAFDDDLLGFGLHLVHGGDTSTALWHSVFNGISWSPNVTLPGQGVKNESAANVLTIAAHDGAIHLVHQGVSTNHIWHSWFEGTMGRPLTGRVVVADGYAIYFEWGCTFQGASTGNVTISCQLTAPRIGNPDVVTTALQAQLNLNVSVGSSDIPLTAATRQIIAQRRPRLFEELWTGRLMLKPVGKSGLEIPLVPVMYGELISTPTKGKLLNIGGLLDTLAVGVHLRVNGSLEHRQLYDLVLHPPGAQPPVVVAAHCLYARTDWNEFSLVHATDLHVSARCDTIRRRLVDAGRPASAAVYNSCNDDLRDFIRYANHQHALGALDAIVFTGDLVDYQFDVGQSRGRGGNFAVFEALLRGQSPYPDSRGIVAEELRVPTFMTLGNHDYRSDPYELLANIHVAVPIVDIGITDIPMPNYNSMNLTREDAEALQPGGTINLTPDQAMPMVRPHEPGLAYYFDRLNNARAITEDGTQSSFVVRLGNHRIVMIDTGPDADIIEGLWEGLAYKYGFSNENEKTFASNGPNSKGMTSLDLQAVTTALRDSANGGVVLIGMHAPPFHTWGEEYPHYFRETEHPSLRPELFQVEGYLRRQAPSDFIFLQSSGKVVLYVPPGNNIHSDFPRTSTPWFMEGSPSDLLDYCIAKNNAENLLKLCCGVNQPRSVDLVLCGHTHLSIECRVQWSENKFRFFTDFYTEHPQRYYRSKYSWLPSQSANVPIKSTIKYDVEVAANAPLPVPPPSDTDTEPRKIPPYANELSNSANPQEWWQAHRPLVIQTAGLGPIEATQRVAAGSTARPGPTFHGFRVVTIKNNSITRIHLVTMSEIQQTPVQKLSVGVLTGLPGLR